MEKTASQQEEKEPERDRTNQALNRAMALCSRKEYCISDIRQKLESWGLESDKAGDVIAVLIRENFINEERYAGAFVRDKYRYNKWGRVKIISQLRVKGIPSGIIDSAMSNIDEVEYRQMIRDMLSPTGSR